MYDMYPEWGPAKHRSEDAETGPAVRGTVRPAAQTALDLRDDGGERPDDN